MAASTFSADLAGVTDSRDLAAPVLVVAVVKTTRRGASRCLVAQNLLNRVNKSSYVGVMTSPYFMHATSAQAARRVELGWRFSF